MATETKKIQLRRDTAANWTSNNPTMSAGEFGFETDTGKFKIGDGSTAWTSLNYAALLPAALAATTTGNGASLVGVEDSATYFTGTTVEAVLAELYEYTETVENNASSTYLQESDLTDRVLAFNAGGSASTARPTADSVLWYNTPSKPTNLGTNDIWVGDTLQQFYIPATSMTPTTTSGAAAVTRELATNDIMIEGLGFDGSADEHAMFWVAMPQGWNEGTVTARFIWTHNGATTNFGVAWALQGGAYTDGDAGDAALGTAIVTTDTGGTDDDIYVSAESSAITIGGTPAEHDIIAFKVYRDVSDAGDTMTTADADLLGIRLTFTRDSVSDE